jgi:uncharacterized protein (TIGR00297 family)
MIIPDAMAAIIGENFANRYFVPLGEKKSSLGTLTMFILAYLIVFFSLRLFFENTIIYDLTIAFIISIVASIAELMSVRGSDNLSVPLIAGLFLYYTLNSPGYDLILSGMLAAAAVSFFSFWLKFLDIGASLLVFIMGSLLFGFGGWQYALPILLFFMTSSFLSKVGKGRKAAAELMYQKSNRRDFYQVLANGGIPTLIFIIILLSGEDYLYAVYLISIAAANADTWATELGIFSKRAPFLIINFKRVKAGTSGAISFVGSISSLLGSAIIVLSGFIFIPFSLDSFMVLSVSGYLGSIIDSILGAAWQAQYKCISCSKLTENKLHCNQEAMLIKGIPWLDNDLVNIFSIFIASIIAVLFLHMYPYFNI